jgi:hypothetical protein
MSQKIDSLQLPVPQGAKQSGFGGRVAALAVGLTAIALLAAVLTAVLPGEGLDVQTFGSAALPAANPELMVADRYLRAMTLRSEVALLSTSPELMVARDYAEVAAKKAETALLAANPELIAVQHHGAPMALTLGSILDGIPAPQVFTPKAALTRLSEYKSLAVNPELITFQRYGSTGSVE